MEDLMKSKIPFGSEGGQKFQKALEFYSSLPYDQQRIFLRSLSLLTKPTPHSIIFTLDSVGIRKMAEVITYCKKYSIPYTPEKRGQLKVAFIFPDLSARNSALIGRLTLK
jgi:hypothetical protein